MLVYTVWERDGVREVLARDGDGPDRVVGKLGYFTAYKMLLASLGRAAPPPLIASLAVRLVELGPGWVMTDEEIRRWVEGKGLEI